jgi:flagellar biosynthesis chaperone FliJ
MAKRFKFRLTTLRKLRKQRQDECRRAVGAKLRQVAGAQEQLDGFGEQLALHTAAMRRLASPAADAAAGAAQAPTVWTVDLTAVRRHRAYTDHLRASIVAGRQQLAVLEAELSKEQVALGESTKEIRILDKLEEGQRRRHELTLTRAEVAQNDEITAQFARRNAPAGVAAGAMDDRP